MSKDRDKTLRAGVLGHPVSHSVSPLIFGFLSRKLGKDFAYERIDVEPAGLKRFFTEHARARTYLGWNVTIPHKQSIARLARELAPEAKFLGATNVVQFRGGRSKGHNTDVIGIAETLREQKFDPRGKTAVLFGAGGAALATAYVLGTLRAREVFVVNRTVQNSRALCRKLNSLFPRTQFIPQTQSKVEGALQTAPALWVNATPLGMKGFPQKSVLSAKLAKKAAPRALAFDLIYRPENTVFLRAAKRAGLRTVGGLDMLIWQAIGTWEIWFGKLPSRAARRSLKASLTTYLRKNLG